MHARPESLGTNVRPLSVLVNVAQSAREFVVSMKRFSQALDTRNFRFGRSRIEGVGNPVAGYYGLD